MGKLIGIWRRLLAHFRLSDEAICEKSRGLPPDLDYHDWPDSDLGYPWHMVEHICVRCGKKFII